MDDDGTKVLPNQQQPLQFNRIHPNEIEADAMHSEGGPQSEVRDDNRIKGTKLSEQAPPVKEAVP
jgi:hypothetical protein